MFGISLGEMLIIGAACLIVIGPKRMPETARFVGHLYSRASRQVASIRSDIKREMEVEDMRKTMREAEQAARGVADDVKQAAKPIASDLESAAKPLTAPADQALSPPAASESANSIAGGQQQTASSGSLEDKKSSD